jgi:hypothetical protein
MKKNGKIIPCVDYRRLNSVTKKDAFPLPRIQDCLDTVSGATLKNLNQRKSHRLNIWGKFAIVTPSGLIPLDAPKLAVHCKGP